MERVELKVATTEETEAPSSAGQSPKTTDANALPAPRPTSAKQIEANRRNALHSTGPRTPEGKQASRLNAVKHGLRANEVIIPGQEDPAEFEAIRTELYEDWQPEGHTERHLVDQIGVAEWWLRRALRAELGVIRRQMASSAASDSEAELSHAYKHDLGRLPELVAKDSAGIPYLRGAVTEALHELEHEGTVSKQTCDTLKFYFSKMPYDPTAELRGGRRRTDMDEADNKAAARKSLETVVKDLDDRERRLRERETTELEVDRQRLSIPQGPELERIQRYEIAIKREMRRDIDQLERMQRRRRGEQPLPTVNINVSNDD